MKGISLRKISLLFVVICLMMSSLCSAGSLSMDELSLGGIQLGESRSNVDAMYGDPTSWQAGGVFCWYGDGSVKIRYHAENWRVQGISNSENNGFTLGSTGIHVGDDVSVLDSLSYASPKVTYQKALYPGDTIPGIPWPAGEVTSYQAPFYTYSYDGADDNSVLSINVSADDNTITSIGISTYFPR